MRSLEASLILLSLAGCALPEDGARTSTAGITGGGPEQGYAAVFSLAYMGEGGCTGTCVTPKVGTTAAHCIEDTDPPSTLSALFGQRETAPTDVVQVVAWEKEPSGADFALVAFASACPAVIPYNTTALETHVGETAVVVGYGVTSEWGEDFGDKRSGIATLFSVDPTQVPGMEPGELATGNDPGGTCYGDSGGPTFMKFGGVEYMVGVTSRGSNDPRGEPYPCGEGVSIAVRSDSYAAFIDQFVAQYDPPVEPPDAGTSYPDASEPDLGSAPDTGPPAPDAHLDAAAPDAVVAVETPDAGAVDRGFRSEPEPTPIASEGCSCSTSRDEAALWPALLLMIAFLPRRRLRILRVTGR